MKDNFVRKAVVLNTIDGDTIDCEIDLGYNLKITKRIRLLGIDTPERGRDGYKEATEFTRKSLLGKTVHLQSEKADVFGRYLAIVFLQDGTDFNQVLLDEKLAKVYKRP